jgi:hypothetical protein
MATCLNNKIIILNNATKLKAESKYDPKKIGENLAIPF